MTETTVQNKNEYRPITPRSKTAGLALMALMAALTAVCSQLAIPLPLIPINFALFAVYLSGSLLGWKMGILSQLLYLLLGAFGVPVFAGFKGGFAVLAGPTGGYLIGYLLAAVITGILCEKFGAGFFRYAAAMLIGLAACYAFGTVHFMILMKTGLVQALLTCVVRFLPGDFIKIALASLVTLKLLPIIRRTRS